MEKAHRGIVGIIVIFFALLFLYSKFGPAIPFSVISQDRGAPLVIEGQGKVTVVPDIVKVSLGIEETGTSLMTVQKSVNQKSKDLLDALKKLGIEEKDIKTTSYNIYPEYNYGGVVPLSATGSESAIAPSPGRIPTISGYRVSTTYEVKVRDFDKINDVISIATQKGANVIGNVSFEINEETKNDKLNEARKEAVARAKEKAQGLASAAGITLGKIINIAESSSSGGPIPLAVKEAGDTNVTQPEIQPGETELSVTVSVSWEIR